MYLGPLATIYTIHLLSLIPKKAGMIYIILLSDQIYIYLKNK